MSYQLYSEPIESEVILLWFDILTAAKKGCIVDEAATATNLHRFAQILLQYAGEKGGNGWGRGLLGAIGIVKQQQISLKYCTKIDLNNRTNLMLSIVLDF